MVLVPAATDLSSTTLPAGTWMSRRTPPGSTKPPSLAVHPNWSRSVPAGGLLFLPFHRVTVMTGLPPASTSSWTTARLEGRPTLPTAALW